MRQCAHVFLCANILHHKCLLYVWYNTFYKVKKSKNRRKIQRSLKIIQSVCRIFLSLVKHCNRFPKWDRKRLWHFRLKRYCTILFQCRNFMLTSAKHADISKTKKSVLPNITFIFNRLSENGITFFRIR